MILFSIILLFLPRLNTDSIVGIDLDCHIIRIGLAKLLYQIRNFEDIYNKADIPATLYIKDNELKIGRDALDMLDIDPDNVFLELPCLMSKSLDDYEVKRYSLKYPYHKIHWNDKKQMLMISNKYGLSYSVEYLLGLFFVEVYNLAVIELAKLNVYNKEILKEIKTRVVVIAIPSDFKQKERIGVFKIFKLINIEIIKLVDKTHSGLINFVSKHLPSNFHSGTYGLLNFGDNAIEITFSKIEVRKVQFQLYSYTSHHLNVISTSFVKEETTLLIIHRLLDHFKKLVIDKWQEKIDVNNSKILGKLIKGVHELLYKLKFTKNAKHKIINLFNSTSYTLSLNDEDLDAIFSKTSTLLIKFLKNSMKDLPGFWIIPSQIIFIGDGKYFPIVSDALKESFKKTKILSFYLPSNSIVFGSLIYGINYLPGLFHESPTIEENYITDIQIKLILDKKILLVKPLINKNGKNTTITHLIKKIDYDFSYLFFYSTIANPNVDQLIKIKEVTELHKVNIQNVKFIIDQIKEKPSFTYKGIRITYMMDKNKIFKLKNIEAISILSREMSLDESKVINKTNSSSKVILGNQVYEVEKIKLNYTIKYNYNQISKKDLMAEKKKINMKLKSIKDYRIKQSVRNELQFYINDVKRKFQNEDYIACTTKFEKGVIWSFLEDTSRWMGNTIKEYTTKEEYMEKFDKLINLTEKIDLRVQEKRVRNVLVKKMNQLLETTQHFIRNMFMTSEPGKLSKNIFSQNETKALRKMNKNVKIWFNNYLEKIKNITDHDDPIIPCKDLIEKIEIVDKQHKTLLDLWEKRLDPNNKDRSTYNPLIENIPENKTECNESDGCSLINKENLSTSNTTETFNETTDTEKSMLTGSCSSHDDPAKNNCPIRQEPLEKESVNQPQI